MFDKLKSKFGSDKKASGSSSSRYAPPAGAPPPVQGGYAPPPGAPPAGALGLSGPLGENQLASLRRFVRHAVLPNASTQSLILRLLLGHCAVDR